MRSENGSQRRHPSYVESPTMVQPTWDTTAEREGCELLTADDRLIRGLQATFPFIKSLTTLPCPGRSAGVRVPRGKLPSAMIWRSPGHSRPSRRGDLLGRAGHGSSGDDGGVATVGQ